VLNVGYEDQTIRRGLVRFSHADTVSATLLIRPLIMHVSETSAMSASLWERTDQPARHDMDGFQAA